MPMKVLSLPSRTKLSESWINHGSWVTPIPWAPVPSVSPKDEWSRLASSGCSPHHPSLCLQGCILLNQQESFPLSSEQETFSQRNVSVQLEKMNYSTSYHVPWRGWPPISVSHNQGYLFFLNLLTLLIRSLLFVLGWVLFRDSPKFGLSGRRESALAPTVLLWPLRGDQGLKRRLTLA